MLPESFAFLSTVIASLGSLHYMYLTIKGEVRPNKMTFFFWGLFPLITFFAQQDKEVSDVVWITLSVGLLPFMILVASYLNPAAYWKIVKRDYVLAGIAILSMSLWYVTKEANLAILFALLADFFASLPTIVKSYRSPESEDWRPYAINAFGFFIGVLSIQHWVFADYSFVLYLFFVTSLIAAIIYYRQHIVELKN